MFPNGNARDESLGAAGEDYWWNNIRKTEELKYFEVLSLCRDTNP